MNSDSNFPWDNSFLVEIPTRIKFGWGSAARIDQVIADLGQHCLLVTEPNLLEFPVVQEILAVIKTAGCNLEVYTDVEREASVSSIDRAAGLVNDQPLDFLVAVGGGSVMDFCKSLSIMQSHPGPIWDFVGYGGRTARAIERELPPVVTVPTTAGTGSEVTPYAVLVNQELGAKATVISPDIAPYAAVVDPSLTVSLPPGITAYTGADALAQCVESYLNYPNRTPFSALLSQEGIRAASKSLGVAVEQPQDKQARSLMAWASLLGGISISMAGTGLGHAVAEILGGLTHQPHGRTVALLLPAVLKMLEIDHDLDFPDLRRNLGNPNQPAHQQIIQLWKEIELPLTAKDLGIDLELRSTLRQETLSNAGWAMEPNPVHITEDDLDRVLGYLWEG